jgi:hypothetical protein
LANHHPDEATRTVSHETIYALARGEPPRQLEALTGDELSGGNTDRQSIAARPRS